MASARASRAAGRSAAGVGGFDQALQHVEDNALNAAAEQEPLAAGKALHRRHQPQQEAVVGFQRRTRAARPVLGGGSRRGGSFGSGLRGVFHGSCAPRSQSMSATAALLRLDVRAAATAAQSCSGIPIPRPWAPGRTTTHRSATDSRAPAVPRQDGGGLACIRARPRDRRGESR